MGAKIDAIDSYGQTPIYLSLVHKRFSIVSMLLKNGASFHTRNTAGLTLLESALKFNHNLDRQKVLFYNGMM